MLEDEKEKRKSREKVIRGQCKVSKSGMRTEGMTYMKEKKKWWGQGFCIHYTVSNPMQREGFTLYRKCARFIY